MCFNVWLQFNLSRAPIDDHPGFPAEGLPVLLTGLGVTQHPGIAGIAYWFATEP